jgi:phospholipid N-methyltransferase
MNPRPNQFPPKTDPRRKTSAMRPDWLLMFSKFLKQGTDIASFVPSSKWLARSIIKGIDFDRSQCIVELGAGTGPITEELIQAAKSHTKLVIIERDADFCRRLRERFPKHDIVEGDAAKLDEILKERGIAKADHVISGLPLPSFPSGLRDSIIEVSARTLVEGGTFRQLTNMPWVYYRLYCGYFQDVSFRFVPWNFPPAGVYVCRGLAAR